LTSGARQERGGAIGSPGIDCDPATVVPFDYLKGSVVLLTRGTHRVSIDRCGETAVVVKSCDEIEIG